MGHNPASCGTFNRNHEDKAADKPRYPLFKTILHNNFLIHVINIYKHAIDERHILSQKNTWNPMLSTKVILQSRLWRRILWPQTPCNLRPLINANGSPLDDFWILVEPGWSGCDFLRSLSGWIHHNSRKNSLVIPLGDLVERSRGRSVFHHRVFLGTKWP